MDAKYRTPWGSDKMLKSDDCSHGSDTDGSQSGDEVHVTMEGLLQGSFHDRKSAPQKKKKNQKTKKNFGDPKKRFGFISKQYLEINLSLKCNFYISGYWEACAQYR